MNKVELIIIDPILDTETGKVLLPATGHDDDAGIDCYALHDIELPPMGREAVKDVDGSEVPVSVPVHLGFGIKMPRRTLFDRLTHKYWHAELTSRSSQNKRGVLVLRGIIDQSYLGEYVVCLVNLNPFPIVYRKGERICQMLFYKERKIVNKKIRVLESAKRGKGAFGSTGR